MTSAVEEQVNPNPEVDSDPEDDPGKMLNVWLGQLQKVRKMVFRVSRNKGILTQTTYFLVWCTLILSI